MTIDKARRKQVVARWHRRLAVIVSLWLAVLATSGILINHAHDLGLDRKPLPVSMQSLVYGVEDSGRAFCEIVMSIGTDCAEVFARLPLDSGELLLGESSLYILDDDRQLVEKLGVAQFGLDYLRAGLRQGADIYLRNDRRTVRADAGLLDWQVLDQDQTKVLEGGDWQFSAKSSGAISWERFMLDLHAARFLGPIAKSFNDLIAAFILILSISGIWLFRLKRNGNGNGQSES